MPLTRDDVQNGHVLDGPDGEVTVVGRVQSDSGQFVILAGESGAGSLLNEGTLYDHEDYTLKSRPAVSGVAAAQEASEVAALRAQVAKQQESIQALLDRDTLRRADEAEAAAAKDVEPVEVPVPDQVAEVPGPAAVSAEAEVPGPPPVITPDPNRPGEDA